MKIKYYLISVGLVLGIGALLEGNASAAPIKIIVNTQNQTKEVSRKFLSEAFLKKIVFWENGESIVPVDREFDADSRKEFSNRILNKSVTAVRSYWQQMIFSGQAIPPVELNSEDQVIQFVNTHVNAVAYIAETTVLKPKLKVKVLYLK